MRVGVIGIGIIGRAVVNRMSEAEIPVSIFNRSMDRIRDLDSDNLIVQKSAEDLIKASEYVILTVSDREAIDEVLFSSSVDFSSKVIIQMGTISPQQSQDLQNKIVSAGGRYVESPILGSRREIQQKSIILLVGCVKELYSEVSELLHIFGENVHYLGAVGKASALKLAMNNLIAMHAAGMSLSLGMIKESQIDPQIFMGILKTSSLYAPMFDKKLKNWLSNEYSDPNFPTKHLLKDVDLIANYTDSIGLQTNAIRAVRAIVEKSIELGYGDEDYSAIFKTINGIKS